MPEIDAAEGPAAPVPDENAGAASLAATDEGAASEELDDGDLASGGLRRTPSPKG